MPERIDQVDSPLSLMERKEQLVLACMADRAAWVQACAPRPSPPLALAGKLMKLLEPLTFLLPGELGRWLRRVEFLTQIGRQLGSFL